MTITPLPSARRFEPYEVFYAGKVGLAAALAYATSLGVEAIAHRNAALAARLRDGLASMPAVTLRDKGAQRSAIVTFTVDGLRSADIRDELRARAINVSTSVLASARLDFPERNLDEVVRASVHYFNTEAEVDALVDAIDRMG